MADVADKPSLSHRVVLLTCCLRGRCGAVVKDGSGVKVSIYERPQDEENSSRCLHRLGAVPLTSIVTVIKLLSCSQNFAFSAADRLHAGDNGRSTFGLVIRKHVHATWHLYCLRTSPKEIFKSRL